MGSKLYKDNNFYYLIQNKTDGSGIKFSSYNDVVKHIKKYNTDSYFYKIVKCIDLPFPNIDNKKEIKNNLDNDNNIDTSNINTHIDDFIFDLSNRISCSKSSIKNIIISPDIMKVLKNMPDIKRFFGDTSCSENLMKLYFIKYILSNFLTEESHNKHVRLFVVSTSAGKIGFMFIIDCISTRNSNIQCINTDEITIYITEDNIIISSVIDSHDIWLHNKELLRLDPVSKCVILDYVENILNNETK